ncbi:RNA polymerase sigma-70 factor [Sphingobacterium olei]|uniref:RNA polymerase sigma-70 factor n=1 Tax=Sphingobacterium olei TaxID=2571155 RepID=A0A4U0P6F7_9SPHI|nr:RNA polymerase sigma-70 factor [Sphingobacterium olei]TJZ63041.1 RNA polymerase sigma-70 factor [Sphingobacterium olei]
MSYGVFNEKQLLAQLQKGSEHAFVELFHVYSPILSSFLANYHLDQEDVSDSVQQTFLKIWEHKDKIDLNSSFKNYIITIAKNDIYNKIKKNVVAEKYRDYTYQHSSPSTLHVSRELEEVLSKILESFPEKRRKVFEMSRIQGYSNKQIAEKLGISKSTVENHINHSSSVVKRLLKGMGFWTIILFFFIFS